MNTIIFCQGDKNELECITGKKYEYLSLNEIDDAIFEKIKPRDYSRYAPQTFIEVYSKRCGYRYIKEKVYLLLRKLDADAIIHYTDRMTLHDNVTWIGFARGTPVRKKK